MMSRALWTGLLLTFAAWSASEAPPPVKCESSNAGTFWPEAANRDSSVRHRAEHCGTLLYCGRSTFGWKWRAMTVNYRAMVAKSHGGNPTPAACAVEPSEPATQ